MEKAMEILRDRLMRDSMELSYDRIEEIPTLRMVLDGIGEEEGGLVVLELSLIPMEENGSTGYYHFMTVLASKLEASQIPSTLVSLNEINAETLIGSYQVISEAGTVVHKYVLRTEESSEEQTAEELYNCLVDVVAVINNDYDRVLGSIEEK